MTSVANPALWTGFIVFVLAMLALDLGVFHRRPHVVRLREAAAWSAVWVALSAVFGLAVWSWSGPERALEFAAGYVIEKALAVDNIFVFVVIFATFAIPPIHQHRILFWGILGALLLRGAFIAAGGAFLAKFHWAIYVFGAILLLTGIRLILQRNHEPHPEKSLPIRILRRILPVADDGGEGRFTVVRAGKRYATPLLLALVVVEFTDVVFAVDSIPAIFAVTSDPFIVFTSNIFAILGLRSLYFLLAGVVSKFRYLKAGLSAILIFVGLKMTAMDFYKVPIGVSLLVITGILGVAVLASVLAARKERPAAAEAAPAETGGLTTSG